MANETMTLIATITVGSGGANPMEFASIPGTYTDLLLIASGRSANASYVNNGIIQFNNTGGTSYFSRRLYGNSGGVASETVSNNDSVYQISQNGSSSTSNTFSSTSIYIPNYVGSTTKTFSVESVTESNSTTQGQIQTTILAGLWNNTAAITNIKFATDTNWVQYSTASLYGILKGSGGATVS